MPIHVQSAIAYSCRCYKFDLYVNGCNLLQAKVICISVSVLIQLAVSRGDIIKLPSCSHEDIIKFNCLWGIRRVVHRFSLHSRFLSDQFLQLFRWLSVQCISWLLNLISLHDTGNLVLVLDLLHVVSFVIICVFRRTVFVWAVPQQRQQQERGSMAATECASQPRASATECASSKACPIR